MKKPQNHLPVQQEEKEPTIITLPNTTEQKMRAIVDLSAAVLSLAKALESVNVQVTVANCHFTATGDGPALNIGHL